LIERTLTVEPNAIPAATTLDDVRDSLVETLGLEDRSHALDAATPLLGHLPELDSMAVVELVTALEDRFEIEIDAEAMTTETFETLGSLTAMVDGKLR
jgi:acyl carrier protein